MTEQRGHFGTNEEFGAELRSLRQRMDEQKERREPFSADIAFSNDVRLVGETEEDGAPAIRFTRDGETIIDMREYLPEGFSFTRKPNENLELRENDWYMEQETQSVNVGDITDPESLLELLHEIGHAHEKRNEEILTAGVAAESSAVKAFNPNRQKKAHQVMRLIAARERRAWVYAVKTFREIAQKAAFDTEKIFPTQRDLTTFIHAYLESYRQGVGLKMRNLFTKRQFQNFAEELWDAFHGKGVTEKKLNEDLRD